MLKCRRHDQLRGGSIDMRERKRGGGRREGEERRNRTRKSGEVEGEPANGEESQREGERKRRRSEEEEEEKKRRRRALSGAKPPNLDIRPIVWLGWGVLGARMMAAIPVSCL